MLLNHNYAIETFLNVYIMLNDTIYQTTFYSFKCTQGVESCHTMESNQGTKIKLYKYQFFIKKFQNILKCIYHVA